MRKMILQRKNEYLRLFLSMVGGVVFMVSTSMYQGTVIYAQSTECCEDSGCTDESCSQKEHSQKKDSNSVTTDKANTVSQNDKTRISFYAAPLVSSTAPAIACTTKSRPILNELGQNQSVSTVWLNRSGTVIAIQWAGNSTIDKQTETISKTASKNKLSMTEIIGDQRQTALKEFDQKSKWYRLSELNLLTQEEGDVIGARLVQRISGSITLSDQDVEELIKTLSYAYRQNLGSSNIGSNQSCETAMFEAARRNLNDEGLAVLKQALALGLKPRSGEK